MLKKALFALLLFAWAIAALAEDRNQALFAAAASGQLERLDSLLERGADVNSRNSAGRTPLMAAAFSGNVRVIRKLLAFGADPNVMDQRGVTALAEASAQGYEEAVKALIAGGADVFAKEKSGLTLIERARKSGHERIAAILEKAAMIKPVSAGTTDDESSADKKPNDFNN
ncbi:ankyrin repeat domain-containing protein [Methylocaldum marinum]|nr:ankyrin repeat domain-containing protein [Methylocaldum marinum]